MTDFQRDPNNPYGVPGVDDQEPGSAAQQAGVAAYNQVRHSGGSDSQASQAAVNAAAAAGSSNALTQWMAANGTTSPGSAPTAVVQSAWLASGAVDANWMVFNDIPGYQSTNPKIHYGMTPEEKAAFGPSYWAGSSLSPTLQALVNQARTGTEAAAQAASALLASVQSNQVSPAQGAAVFGSIMTTWAKANPVPAAIAGLIGLKLFRVI